MAKRYTDELADWLKKKGSSNRKDKSIIAFLAIRDDIRAAMNEGYSLQTIWEHLHETGKIPFQYETFCKHVRRYIKTVDKSKLPVEKVQPVDETKPKKKEVSGFSFDATPKKEELI
jgi:hypothetical protein